MQCMQTRFNLHLCPVEWVPCIDPQLLHTELEGNRGDPGLRAPCRSFKCRRKRQDFQYFNLFYFTCLLSRQIFLNDKSARNVQFCGLKQLTSICLHKAPDTINLVHLPHSSFSFSLAQEHVRSCLQELYMDFFG